jgi:outer membrane protein assembly factor BamB
MLPMNFGGPFCAASKAAHMVGWVLLMAFSSWAADWPQYRGPNHDGISLDRINKQWTGSVTNPVWRIFVSNGVSSLAVSGGRVFTQNRRLISGLSNEVCMALNATNGMELWATPLDTALYPQGGVGSTDDGPRSTPAVNETSVFVLTSYLKLYRLNVTNGMIVWQKDLRALYGSGFIQYQNCASPLLDGDLIYVNANTNATGYSLMAFRTSDGSVAWRSQNDRLTHSTPVLATIAGVRQLIFATQSGLVSLDPLTGDLLWRVAYPFNYSTSLGVSPVVYEDMVFVCGAHAYGMKSVVVQATFTNNTWATTQLWATNNPASHWMTPVCYKGFLYGPFGIQSFDTPNAQLKCVDMRTGAVKWSADGFGRGATIVVDDHLLTITEKGELVLNQPDTNRYVHVARFFAIPNYADFTNKCWNTPAVCDGKVYVRSTGYIAAFDFSVPDLKLDTPEFVTPDRLRLTVRTVNGTGVRSNRLAGMEVRTTSDISQHITNWSKLTNNLELTNGTVRIDHVASGAETSRVFIVTEPK